MNDASRIQCLPDGGHALQIRAGKAKKPGKQAEALCCQTPGFMKKLALKIDH